MKPKIFLIVILLVFFPFLSVAKDVKSTGIGLRGSYYQMSNGLSEITLSSHGQELNADVGGGGGWLFLYSRVNDNLFIELNLGAVGKVAQNTKNYFDSQVDVHAITPLLIGLRQELLSPYHQSTFRPYFSVGAGPYWISNIIVCENLLKEQVSIKTNLERGGYLGGGFDLKITSWFAVNFDVKYHFIDFNKKHKMSGIDYGLGITFMWGRYSL